MIRYALVCDNGHEFESWFGSSGGFDEQSAAGLVICPVCGSASVSKAMMAPSIASGRQVALVEGPAPAEQEVAPPAPVALTSERELELRDMIRALRQHVESVADNVGDEFASEARRMHYGEIDERPIYGEATREDVRGLLDDGIEVMPLPASPDKGN